MQALKQQITDTLKRVGIPMTVFCRKVGISVTAFYRWRQGDLRLSDEKVDRIKTFVLQFEEVV